MFRFLLPLLTIGCITPVVIGENDPKPLVDADGDQVPEGEDCNDLESRVFPGNVESCDGLDNDCDGVTDGVRPVPGSPQPPSMVCEQSATFIQDMRLDVLFVIDDSNSMLDAQIRVADGIDDLLQWVIGPDFDTHVGAISTDMDDRFARGRLVTVDEVPFADATLTMPLDEWAQQALVLGITGSGDERPLDAVLAALNPDLNPGFRRPDAHLAVVVLSDEDDNSEANPLQFLDTFREIEGPRGASVHALVKLDTDPEDCFEIVAESVISVVDATAGLRESICSIDYGTFLSPVGQASSQRALKTHFPLATPVQLGSLRVIVQHPGGLVEALESGSDFALAPDGDELILLGTPPPAASRITARWLAVPGSVE